MESTYTNLVRCDGCGHWFKKEHVTHIAGAGDNSSDLCTRCNNEADAEMNQLYQAIMNVPVDTTGGAS